MKLLRDYLDDKKLEKKLITLRSGKLHLLYLGNVAEIPEKYLDFYVLEHSKIGRKKSVIFIIVGPA